MARPNLMKRRYADLTRVNWGPHVADFLRSLEGPRPKVKRRETRLVNGKPVPWTLYESTEEMRQRRGE